MCTIVPTLLLLCPEESGNTPAYQFAVSQLVSLATTQAAAFKVAAAGLDSDRRILLETTIRKALQGGRTGSEAAGMSKPKAGIELRSFGS
jgi:HEAT repeat-containing protein 5